MEKTAINSTDSKPQKPVLYPIYEVELNENFGLSEILENIENDFQVPYRLIKADVEYVGKFNYGTFIIHLTGEKDDNMSVIYFLNRHKIQSTLRGYAEHSA